jgi:hypothetical protein
MRSPPSGPVRCQLSSVATQLSNGTLMIRANDSQYSAELMRSGSYTLRNCSAVTPTNRLCTSMNLAMPHPCHPPMG